MKHSDSRPSNATMRWLGLITLVLVSSVDAQDGARQEIMGPGLYVFQTRITAATCNDATRTGFVTSYYAAIDGVPGSRAMSMNLLNSSYWPRWSLTISQDSAIVGEARQAGVTGPRQGRSRFEVRRNRHRFTGTGTREYSSTANGRTMRCAITYDALIKRIDEPARR